MFHGVIHNSTQSLNAACRAGIAACIRFFLAATALFWCGGSTAQVLIVQAKGDTVMTFQGMDGRALRDSLRSFHVEAHRSGFLQSRTDSLSNQGDTLTAFVNRGMRFGAVVSTEKKGAGRIDSLNEAALSLIGGIYLKPLEDNGYPFASALLTTELANDSTVVFSATTERGPFIEFDSLIIRSEKPFSRAALGQYYQIRKGRPYSESILQSIPKKTKELNYARMGQAPQVVFKEGKADVYLWLDDVKASRFDGIIGFQPDAATGRPVFTGDLSLYLENALRRSEQIEFQWRRLQEQTQNLKLTASLPYLLQTRLGIWGGVELYRRDSTFSTSDVDLALGYLIGADRYLRTFIERWSSNALRDGVAGVDNVSLRRYGVALRLFELDDFDNPMRGSLINTELGAGLKDLTPASDLGETIRVSQYSGTLTGGVWMPLASRWSLVMRVNAGFKADSTLRLNEHYRIGGLTSLRGFDEESIFARSYSIGTLELKYRLDRKSAVLAFLDQGWYDRIADGSVSDTPFGFGVGALIGTENSTFRIFYALGREQNNPVLVRNGKVHFGFINRF